MHHKIRLLIFLLLLPVLLSAKVAELSPRDVNAKVNELLFAHISQKKLTEEIMKRALVNFIEEMDPLKTYFIEEEIAPYLNPKEEDLTALLNDFYKSNFSQFDNLYQIMIGAIKRRDLLEEELKNESYIEHVTAKQVEREKWASSEEDLKVHLHRIKSLQAHLAEKIEEPNSQDKFLKLVQKRRKWKEEEIQGKNEKMQKRILHAHILKAIASSLDSHTVYFPPSEASQFMMMVQQRLVGIGISFVDDLTGFRVVSLIDGGPAKVQGGLKEKDLIVSVDGEYVVGMDINQAVQLIRGKEGTKVELTLLRAKDHEDQNPEKLVVSLERGEVVIEEVRYETALEPFADGHIAHVTLHSFYQDPQNSCAQDLFNKITELKSKYNIKGIVLDLRNNTGGILPQAVAVNSLFMGKGIVASIKKYDGTLHHLRNVESSPLWNGPLIVLVNKLTASAAEIVAQSLQDYGRALVIGDERTFGKGTYQVTTINVKNDHINPQGEYKVTEGMYYTVSGKSPQLVGVLPDIIIPSYLAEAKVGEKFSKYPVENNSISANFEDRLDDIPLHQKDKAKRYYHFDLQPILTTYNRHLPLLKEHAQKRIEANKDYQKLLTHLKQTESSDLEVEYKGGDNDFQLLETFNIMKDLIYLHEKAESES
jgi:carboxyl-terminal processing protease